MSLGQKNISSDSLRKCSRRPKNQVFDNNKKVKKRIKWLTIRIKWKKVKMAKVYTELKNMDACDDNYQVRQILIKFSYFEREFSWAFSEDVKVMIFFGACLLWTFWKEEVQKQQNVKSNTLFIVEYHLRESYGHRKGIGGVNLVYCQQVI